MIPGARDAARAAALLAAYFALVCALRLILFPGGPDDDGEVLYYTQSWAWAYKTGQPPLYFWLVRGLEDLAGPALGAVLGLKYVLLAAFYFFAWLAARRLLAGDRLFAALAPFGLLACYFIGWETAVSYNSTILALTAMAAALWLLLRLEDRGGWAGGLPFALAVAVGLLAKHTYALFLVPALVGAWRHPGLRPRLADVGVLLPLAGAIALTVAIHNVGHDAGAKGLAAMTGQGGWLAARASGLYQLTLASLGLLSPFLPMTVVLFPGAFRPLARPETALLNAGRFLEGYLVALVALGLAAVLVFALPDVRNNWMVIWFPAVFYGLLRVKVFLATTPAPRRLRWFAVALVAVAMAIPLGMVGRGLIAPKSCRKCNFFIPYDALARAIVDRGFHGGTVVADDAQNQIAGNLRRFLPDGVRVVSSHWRDYAPPAPPTGSPGHCLIVWRGGPGQGAQARDEARRRLNAEVPETAHAHTVLLTLPRGGGRQLDYSFHLLPGSGQCR